MSDRPIACVVWADAHGNAMTTYEAHEVPHAPAVVHTYGVIIRQDNTGITIASEVFEAGSFRGVTFIPALMVTDVRYYHVRTRRPRTAPVVPGSVARDQHQSVERPRADPGPD